MIFLSRIIKLSLHIPMMDALLSMFRSISDRQKEVDPMLQARFDGFFLGFLVKEYLLVVAFFSARVHFALVILDTKNCPQDPRPSIVDGSL
jgi:hypothetical protein